MIGLCTIGRLPYPARLRDHPQDRDTYVALGRHLRRIYVLAASQDRRAHVSHTHNVTAIAIAQGRHRWLNPVLFVIAAVRIGLRLHRRGRVQVFAAGEPVVGGTAALLLRRLTQRPLVVHLLGELLDLPHSELHPARRTLVRALARHSAKRATRVRCVSRSVLETARAMGVPADRLDYLPMRVDLSVFARERHAAAATQLRERLHLNGRKVILFLGAFTTHKGVLHLVRAFARILQQTPDAVLLMVGSGPLQQQLAEEISALRIADRVRFPGRAAYADVPAYIGASDALVLPSLNEGLPRVILEAMAMQLPVVASRVGGVPELIEHERTGLLVPPADPSALADALNRILADDALRARITAAGLENVEGACEFHQNVARYADIILRAAAPPARTETAPAALPHALGTP